MSFLDKLHRNDQSREVRPEAELKKLFKGKDKSREHANEQDEQEDGNAIGRLARVALGTAADGVGNGVEKLQGKVDDFQADVQGRVDDAQGTVDDVQATAKKKLPGKGEKIHKGVDAAQAKVDQGVAYGQGKVDQGQVAVQNGVDNVLDPIKTPTKKQQTQEATHQSDSAEIENEEQVTEQPEKKKKKGLFGALAKVGIKPELNVGGFEIGIDDERVSVDGKAGKVDVHGEQEYGKGKKLGRDANVSANGTVGDVNVNVNARGADGGVEGDVSASGNVRGVELTAQQEFGKDKRLGRDASVEAKTEILGMPVKGSVDGKDVFKDEGMTDRERIAKQVLDGGMEIAQGDQAWNALEGLYQSQQDNVASAKKGNGGRLTKIALDREEEKTEGETEEKTGSANDKHAKDPKGDKELDEKKDVAAKDDASHHEEDENQDAKKLPGKVGAVAKVAKQELEHAGKDSADFAVDSKRRLEEKAGKHAAKNGMGVDIVDHKQVTKTADGHGMGLDISGEKKTKADGHGLGVDVPGKKPQTKTADGHGMGVDLDGDGKADKKGKHQELEHHGLLSDEDQGGELEDAEGGKVPYSPMKSKGAPTPKASKGAQPGGHAKPPPAPQLPANLTSKNQAGINAYIAQAKAARDNAKSKVQAQQVAKSQQVAVDAKAIAAQVKQKNDQRLASLRQQAEAKKQQAEQEAKEKQQAEGPVTVESLKQKLETTAEADKKKLTDSFTTKKAELEARMATQKEVLKSEADKQIANLKTQQAAKKKAAEDAWAREKKTLEDNKKKLLEQVRQQTAADEKRLYNDRDKIIAATNNKVTQLTATNESNCKKILDDGDTKAGQLISDANTKAGKERTRGSNEAAGIRSTAQAQAAKTEDEGQKKSILASAEGRAATAISRANTAADDMVVKGKLNGKAAQAEAKKQEGIARGKGEKAIKDVKDAQNTQCDAIKKKIESLNGLADEKIRNAETQLNAKLKAGDDKIKKVIEDTETKANKIREDAEKKIATLEKDGTTKLQKDYDAAMAAIEKRVEATLKQLNASNGKNLKQLEKMVADTCKAIDKTVTDTEKKFDHTVIDAESKAQAFVLSHLQKIKAEADKALKEIDNEFAAAMKRVDDMVAKTQNEIDETAKGKMLEIEVHTATLLADIGEGSRLDAAKKQLEWYIKNKQPIPMGYGQEPAPKPSETQTQAANVDAGKTEEQKKKEEEAKKNDPNAPKPPVLTAAEEDEKKAREALLKEDNLTPEGIAAKVEEQLKKGRQDTASAKADEATVTIAKAHTFAKDAMSTLVDSKTAELEQVRLGNPEALKEVDKQRKSEKDGEKAAKEIDEALKQTNWYGGKKPDKAAIMKALEGKDAAAIEAMRAELEKRGIKLDDIIKQELSGDQLEEATVRLKGDPLMGDLVALKNAQGHRLTGNEKGAIAILGGPLVDGLVKGIAGDTVGEDKERIQALLKQHKDAGTLAEFAKKYEEMTGQSIQHLLKVTDSQDIAKGLGPEYETKKDERSKEDIQKAADADVQRMQKELLSDPDKAKHIKGDQAPAARKLVEALNGLHLDSTRGEMVTEALKGKTKEEVELIKAMYKRDTGRDLDSDMQGRLSGATLMESKAHMRQDKTGIAVAKIMGSEDASWTPWTVDDSKMHAALKELSDPEERRAVLAEYERRTGKKLQDVIAQKMTGNDEALAKALAEGDSVKARAVELDEATNGGWMNGMHKAIAERTGMNTEPLTRGLVNQMISPVGGLVSIVAPDAKITIGGYTIENGSIHKVDSDKIFQLLEESPNPADRARIKALYKEQTGRDMDDDMSKSLVGPSGDRSKLDAYNAVQDGRMDDYYAARMDDSLSGLNDSKAFHAQLEGKPEWQRKQILDAWKKRHPNESFDDVLNDQFGGDSLDKQKANMLANSKDDPVTGAVKLPDEFVLRYAQDSVWTKGAKFIDDHTGFVDKYPMLMMIPGVGQAKAAAYFMRGWGVDSDAIKNTLKGKSKAEIEELKKKYPDLEKDLNYTLSGRDLYEINLQLKEGEPQTDEEKIKRRLAMHEFDRGEGGSWIPGLGLSKISNGITDLISPSGQLMDKDKDFLLSQLTLLQNGQELPPEAKLALRESLAGMEESTKHFMESRAAVTEAIATAVGVVVGAVVTVLTGGIAGAILAALATGVATVGTKMVMLGQSYGRNEMGVDIAMTAVQMATAGLGGGLTKMSQSFLTQVLNGAIGNAASAFVQTAITSKDAHDLLGLLAQATKSGLVGFVSGGAGAAVTAQLQEVMGQLSAKAFGKDANLGGIFVRGFVTGSGGAAATMFVEALADPSMMSGDWDKILWNMTNTIVIQGGLSNAISETAEGHREARESKHAQVQLATNATEAAKRVRDSGGSLDDQKAAFAKVMGEGAQQMAANDQAASAKAEADAKDPNKAAEKAATTKPADNTPPADTGPTQAVDPKQQKVSEHKTLGEAVNDMNAVADKKTAKPDEHANAAKPHGEVEGKKISDSDIKPDTDAAKTADVAPDSTQPKAELKDPSGNHPLGDEETAHKAKVDERVKELRDQNPSLSEADAKKQARNEALHGINDTTPGPQAEAAKKFGDAIKSGDGDAALKALDGVTDLAKSRELIQNIRQQHGNAPIADILKTLPADQQAAIKKHLEGLQANPKHIEHAQKLIEKQAELARKVQEMAPTAYDENGKPTLAFTALEAQLLGARQEALDAITDAYGVDDTTVAQRMATENMGYGIERGSISPTKQSGDAGDLAEAKPDGHVVAKNHGAGLFTNPDGSPRSPGFIAAALGHEVEIHIEAQLRGGKYTEGGKFGGGADTGTAINETQAYKYMVDNAKRFGLTPSEIEFAQRGYDKHLAILKANDPAAAVRVEKGDFSTPDHNVVDNKQTPWTIQGGDPSKPVTDKTGMFISEPQRKLAPNHDDAPDSLPFADDPDVRVRIADDVAQEPAAPVRRPEAEAQAAKPAKDDPAKKANGEGDHKSGKDMTSAEIVESLTKGLNNQADEVAVRKMPDQTPPEHVGAWVKDPADAANIARVINDMIETKSIQKVKPEVLAEGVVSAIGKIIEIGLKVAKQNDVADGIGKFIDIAKLQLTTNNPEFMSQVGLAMQAAARGEVKQAALMLLELGGGQGESRKHVLADAESRIALNELEAKQKRDPATFEGDGRIDLSGLTSPAAESGTVDLNHNDPAAGEKQNRLMAADVKVRAAQDQLKLAEASSNPKFISEAKALLDTALAQRQHIESVPTKHYGFGDDTNAPGALENDFTGVKPGETPANLSDTQKQIFDEANKVYADLKENEYQGEDFARLQWERILSERGMNVDRVATRIEDNTRAIPNNDATGRDAKTPNRVPEHTLDADVGKRSDTQKDLPKQESQDGLKALASELKGVQGARLEGDKPMRLIVKIDDGTGKMIDFTIKLLDPDHVAHGHAGIAFDNNDAKIWLSERTPSDQVQRVLGGAIQQAIAAVQGGDIKHAGQVGELDGMMARLKQVAEKPLVPTTTDPSKLMGVQAERAKVESQARIKAEIDLHLSRMGLDLPGPARDAALAKLPPQLAAELDTYLKERKSSAIGFDASQVGQTKDIKGPATNEANIGSTVLPGTADMSESHRPYNEADRTKVLELKLVIEQIAECDARLKERDVKGTSGHNNGRDGQKQAGEIAPGESMRRRELMAKQRQLMADLQLAGTDGEYYKTRIGELERMFPGAADAVQPTIEQRLKKHEEAQAMKVEAKAAKAASEAHAKKIADQIENAPDPWLGGRVVIGDGPSGLSNLATLDHAKGDNGFMDPKDCLVLGGPDLIERMAKADGDMRWGQRAGVFDSENDPHAIFRDKDGNPTGELSRRNEDSGDFVSVGELSDAMDLARQRMGSARVGAKVLKVELQENCSDWHTDAKDRNARVHILINGKEKVLYVNHVDVSAGVGQAMAPDDSVLSQKNRQDLGKKQVLIGGEELMTGRNVEGKRVLVIGYGPTGGWAAQEAQTRGASVVDWTGSANKTGTNAAGVAGLKSVDRVAEAFANSEIGISTDRVLKIVPDGDGARVTFVRDGANGPELYDVTYDHIVMAAKPVNDNSKKTVNSTDGLANPGTMLEGIDMGLAQNGAPTLESKQGNGAVRVLGTAAADGVNLSDVDKLKLMERSKQVKATADSPDSRVMESASGAAELANGKAKNQDEHARKVREFEDVFEQTSDPEHQKETAADATSRLEKEALPRWTEPSAAEAAQESAFLDKLDDPGGLHAAVELCAKMSHSKDGVQVFGFDVAKKLYSSIAASNGSAGGEGDSQRLHPTAVAVARIALLRRLDEIKQLGTSHPGRTILITNKGNTKNLADPDAKFGAVWRASSRESTEFAWIEAAAKERGLKVIFDKDNVEKKT